MPINDPIKFIEWMACSIHQKFHGDCPWENCSEHICCSAKIFINKHKQTEKVWITADKKIIPLNKMDDVHLLNAHNYMKKKIASTMYNLKKTGITIKQNELINAEFPVFNDLREEIVRRETIKTNELYNGTRNLDI